MSAGSHRTRSESIMPRALASARTSDARAAPDIPARRELGGYLLGLALAALFTITSSWEVPTERRASARRRAARSGHRADGHSSDLPISSWRMKINSLRDL